MTSFIERASVGRSHRDRRKLDSVSATPDALIAENRRLRRELQQREQRLRAFERSRWWRLHPRRLLPGGGSRVEAEHTTEQPSAERASDARLPAATVSTTTDPWLAAFQREVIGRGSFSQDWVTNRFSSWRPILEELESRPMQILEIGSFEGLSACYLLWRLPRAHITCVDPFIGTPEQAGLDTRGLQEMFDANVGLIDSSRVRKLVGDSRHKLLELAAEDARFELIYVDGSHFGLDVLVDASLSWQLLGADGVIVFDDYRWNYLGDDPLLRPGKAIDAFREVIEGKYELLFADEQVALRKSS
jgi:Methyltransferase domain